MAHLSATQLDAVWAGIDDQRARTAQMLEDLAPGQWDHPSLCEGWTVRHVAAHLTLQRQRPRDAFGFVLGHPGMLRHPTLNRFILQSAVLRAQDLSTEEIVADIRGGIGSRRHNPGVTPLETLTDILVHSQDIALPLGHPLEMRPEPSLLAATRRWETRDTWLARVNRQLPLDGYTLVATDTSWRRGSGPEVTGPIGAILLLLTGRPVALERLDGHGAALLRAASATAGPGTGAGR